MKNKLFFFIAALLLCAMQTSQAQGEWKWAHYWTGNDGSSSDYFNKIINTAFDEDGNIYVYGTMGGNAQYDGIVFQYTNDASVITCNKLSTLLAKFDTLGNMLWYKVMKADNSEAVPLCMEVKNNKVCVAAECAFSPCQNASWLYYWDTVIYKYQVDALPQELQKPPFKAYCCWTCFAQFDLDGHLLDDHFVQAFSRESYFTGSQWVRNERTLTESARPAPVHWDSNGNVYIFTPIVYLGTEEEPYTIVVDVDSNKTYDLYFPGHVDTSATVSWIDNAIMYKFSPDGELLASKLLVDHTDGIALSYDYAGDSINKYYKVYYNGMSFDEDDNMYLTGYVQLGDCYYGYGGELHDYPVHIWWDSTHCMTLNDISSAQQCNFIIKYNTKGEVVWCNQIHSRGSQAGGTGYARAEWGGNVYADNSVYVLGGAAFENDGNALIYFDNESIPLQRFQNELSDITFFVRYNASTGQYVNQGIVPAAKAFPSRTPAVLNNRVFAISNANALNGTECWLSMWRNDGMFILADTFHSTAAVDLYRSYGVSVNKQGYILASLLAKSPVAFDNNVSTNCSWIQSNAVFALYYNPELVEPYVGVPMYEEHPSALKMWPNPANNILHVECEDAQLDYITVRDISGKAIMHGSVLESNASVDVSSLPQGIYLLEAVSNNGEKHIGKFVKSNY